MVSFWPWKGEDNSPASFEKALSTLSSKITQTTSRLDQQRQTSRRFKALWTLYSTFAYLFYSIILALVLGWESWGAKEYIAIAGGPVLIYAVRTAGARVFDYRISRTQHALEELQKQRDETIEKLKVATRYTSTQQLLEKYGGESPKPSPSPNAAPEKRKPTAPPQQPVARTGLPPPPTANIRRPPSASSTQPQPEFDSPPSPPPYQTHVQPQGAPNTPPPPPSPPMPQMPIDEPDFAPNAFPSPGQFIEQPHWYDRLLDVLLGEDEMQPRNRMAMICASCRLVNGQAPPGIKTPEELGRWRCGSCGAWNGVESEATKILSTLRQNPTSSDSREPAPGASSQPTAGGSFDEGAVIESTEQGQQTSSQDSDDVEEAQGEQSEEASKPQPVRRSKRGKGGESG